MDSALSAQRCLICWFHPQKHTPRTSKTALLSCFALRCYAASPLRVQKGGVQGDAHSDMAGSTRSVATRMVEMVCPATSIPLSLMACWAEPGDVYDTKQKLRRWPVAFSRGK